MESIKTISNISMIEEEESSIKIPIKKINFQDGTTKVRKPPDCKSSTGTGFGIPRDSDFFRIDSMTSEIRRPIIKRFSSAVSGFGDEKGPNSICMDPERFEMVNKFLGNQAKGKRPFAGLVTPQQTAHTLVTANTGATEHSVTKP